MSRINRGIPVLLVALSSVGLAWAQKAPNPTITRTEKLAGQTSRETGDLQGRVVTSDGVPTAYALVSLNGPETARSSKTTKTDAEGNFEFTGLDAKPYRLRADFPGYVSTTNTSPPDPEPTFYRIGEFVTLRLERGGVITGKVLDSAGGPVVNKQVTAVKIKDLQNKPVRKKPTEGFRFTDDRGVYRIYGLEPGVYVVFVAGSDGIGIPGLNRSKANLQPVYSPSSSRDMAQEITIRNGLEVSGVDIRFRETFGHAVAGRLAGLARDGGIQLFLVRAGTTVIEATTYCFNQREKGFPFEFNGVPDGEFDLVGFDPEEKKAVQPRRVVVKGADVTGVEATANSLASVTGKIEIELDGVKPNSCLDKTDADPREIVVAARRIPNKTGENALELLVRNRSFTSPNDKREFKIPNLIGGKYFLDWKLPSENLFVTEISPAEKTPKSKNAPAGFLRAPLEFTPAQQVKDVTVRIGMGAASFAGRIVSGPENPSNLYVHLVPSEKEAVENPARYYAAPVQSDGTFAFKNLPPGKYFIVTKHVDSQSDDPPNPQAAFWEAASRQILRREAETAGATVELKTCQRVLGYFVRYAPPEKKPPKG